MGTRRRETRKGGTGKARRREQDKTRRTTNTAKGRLQENTRETKGQTGDTKVNDPARRTSTVQAQHKPGGHKTDMVM